MLRSSMVVALTVLALGVADRAAAQESKAAAATRKILLSKVTSRKTRSYGLFSAKLLSR